MEQPKGFWLRLKSHFSGSKPHFNFITAHYLLILSCAIIGSILVFAVGKHNIHYIDALFFAAGSSTQAGLNPVDVNLLNTAQQIVLYLIPLVANPITVNSMVVYLRLYWFEKHFHQLVKQARQRRTTISKSRGKERGPDPELNVQGVLSSSETETVTLNGSTTGGIRGRRITVMHSSGRTNRMAYDGAMLSPVPDVVLTSKPAGLDSIVQKSINSDASQLSSTKAETNGSDSRNTTPINDNPNDTDNDHVDPIDNTPPRTRGHIAFGSTVKRSDGLDAQTNFTPSNNHGPGPAHSSSLVSEELMSVAPSTASQQPLIRPGLARMVSADGDEILRIPNPREVEQGIVPTRVTRDSVSSQRPDSRDEGQTQALRTTIMIAEPSRREREEYETERDRLADEAEVLKNTFSIFSMPRWLKKLLGKEDDASMPRPYRTLTFAQIRSFISSGQNNTEDMPYLSYTPTTGRNSQFIGLTLEQREELGGIEYRSLRTLAVILGGYFWGFHIFGLCFLLPFIKHSAHYRGIVEAAGQDTTWWGFFTSSSAFMDLGFTLTPDSMYSFNSSTLVMLVMSFLIIIGNTGFPVMLRFIIWLLSLFVPKNSGVWEELRFLLDHPRRCFTLLFPSDATWWLFGVLVILNGVDVILFIILDLNAEVVTDMPVHTRILDALFQAASTRTAGFACLDISKLHPGVQVSYMIMMYISVFPIAISIRRTNVYEERSLGMYESRADEEEEAGSGVSYVGMHLRRQLSFDLWYVFLGLFILAISEGSKIQRNEFEMWGVLFEVISAYGTVGMSLGYTGVNTSLSGKFSTIGKLVIIAMQIRGRHRGLPYGLDRAILLPSQQRFERETQLPPENIPPMTRTMSSISRRGTLGTLGLAKSKTTERQPGILSQLLHPGPALPHEFRKLSHVHLHLPGHHQHGHNMERTLTSMSTSAPGPRRTPQRTNSMPITDDESETSHDIRLRRRIHTDTSPMERSLTAN